MNAPGFPRSRPRAARWLWVTGVVGSVAFIALALLLTRPLPPSRVVMATGSAGGEYDAVGERYRQVFAHNGVRLELQPSRGSVDNVALLRDARSGVSIALVQSGTTNADEAPELVSLGTLFYEPFWLFSREPPSDRPARLGTSLRLSLGVPGSGTYKLGRELAAAVGVDLSRAKLQPLDTAQATEALIKGDVELVAMVLAWDAPLLQRVFLNDSVHVLDWQRADAQVALRPYLSKLVLPRGVIDLARDRPPRDITLLAAKASLVVRKDLHPALQHLLLEAASDIHSGPGVFQKAGQFPAAEPIDLPLSEYASQYYRSGRPFLQRYLPFWLAAFTAQLLLLLIPIVGLLYPLFRVLPAAYAWSMRQRIFSLYGELKFLEAQFDASPSAAMARAMSEQLRGLEQRADRLRMPVSFTDMQYTLKQHIDLVRRRLQSALGEQEPRRQD